MSLICTETKKGLLRHKHLSDPFRIDELSICVTKYLSNKLEDKKRKEPRENRMSKGAFRRDVNSIHQSLVNSSNSGKQKKKRPSKDEP